MNIDEIYNSIIADALVDSQEVTTLKTLLYHDGKIDKDEADLLFRINNACSGNANCSEWNDFFVDAICDFLLKDENTPGFVDNTEAEWLIKSIGSDNKIDELEKQLLSVVNTRAKSIPESLKAFIRSNIQNVLFFINKMGIC